MTPLYTHANYKKNFHHLRWKFHNFNHCWFVQNIKKISRTQNSSTTREYYDGDWEREREREHINVWPFCLFRHSQYINSTHSQKNKKKKYKEKYGEKFNRSVLSLSHSPSFTHSQKNVQFHAKKVRTSIIKFEICSPFHHSSSIVFSMPFGYFLMILHGHKTICDS